MANKATGHPNEPRSDQASSERERAQESRGSEQPRTTALDVSRARYLATTYDVKYEQVEVIRMQVCMGASDAELEYFLATCKRLQLDPFTRQINFIKRRQRVENDFGDVQWVEVGRPEISIEGLRGLAERTGEYEGQSTLQWCGPDGKWVEVWLDAKVPPVAAMATIYRKGLREPMRNVAHYAEFVPLTKAGVPMHMWKKMPANQLGKCAEAGGFRRAFPRDLSGLYVPEEMEHTSAGASFAPPPPSASDQKVIDAKGEPTRPFDTREESATSPTTTTSGDRTGALVAAGAIPPGAAALLRAIPTAKVRDDLNEIAKLVSDARKLVNKDPSKADEEAIALVAIVRPALEQRWKELTVPAKGGKS